jgi:hypothetical protein
MLEIIESLVKYPLTFKSRGIPEESHTETSRGDIVMILAMCLMQLKA